MKLLVFLVATLLVGSLAGCAPSDAQNIYMELLQNIPDTPGAPSAIIINDYALVRELNRIPLPGPEADEEAINEYVIRLQTVSGLAPGPWISGYGSIEFFRNRQYLEFDLRDVDQSVMQVWPGALLEVVRGRFSPGATEQAIAACSECPEGQRLEHNGIQFYSWGEDKRGYINKGLSPPAYDKSGRGGRIAVQDDHVFRTIVTVDIRALIDASQGDGRFLADREEFQLLGSALSELDIYSAFLRGDVPQFQKRMQGMLQQMLREERLMKAPASPQATPLLPYVAFATGVGKGQNGLFMAIVLVHADSAAADANVDLLLSRIEETTMVTWQQPWRTLVTSANDVEIGSEGKVLLARLPLSSETSSNIWSQMVWSEDPLLLHE